MASYRPSDHIDTPAPEERPGAVQPRLGVLGYVRFFWRQLTTMRTALFLLLLLAVAAVPGSIFPQESSDPNGVVQYKAAHPGAVGVMQFFQLFDVYTSVWFSAIYLLLFVSLIGCIIPRTRHHLEALRARPPRTPVRLDRLPAFRTAGAATDAPAALESARRLLRRQGYRVEEYAVPHGRSGSVASLSAERGYLRETGNLVFHSALVGVLVTVGVGGGFVYTGQKIIVQGTSFTNALSDYDSFNPGRFVGDAQLEPFNIRLDRFTSKYEINSHTRQAEPVDYNAAVTVTDAHGHATKQDLKVNSPLEIGGDQVYLLSNGYAPIVTVRDRTGTTVFSDPVPFIQQDANITSSGVVKVPDTKPNLAFAGFFYPTAAPTDNGTLTSVWPQPDLPVLSLNLYTGDLGLDDGVPQNVYSLDIASLTPRTGVGTDADPLVLKPGETAQLPDGLGSVTFEGLRRYIGVEVHHDPTQGWVFLFVACAVLGLLSSLFVPRRRMWVKAVPEGDGVRLEYAALARGEDPGLERALVEFAKAHAAALPASGAPPEAPTPAT